MYLEIPVEKDLTDDEVSGDTKEEKKQAKKDAKKFRFLIGAANSSSSSVYSRTSLAESVSRESHVKAVTITHQDEEQITNKFPQAEVEGTPNGTAEDGSNEEEPSAEKAAVISPSTETVDNAPGPLPVA